ncbi:MAG: adenosylcobinamide-GDP ribazoletransferase [Candidatus Methanoperedenaceae archaeon]|nr:adenosylcobinamide-GDP ribazoletransferase [Candidatus Methanoperedenaceae archaeon]
MKSFVSAFLSGFGFLTTIPVGITMEGIENLMKHIYFFPVVGALLGIIIGTVGYGSSFAFHPLIVSFIIIVSIYYFTGFNHLDGLADFGDGIAAHGTREKKVSAMRDTSIGTGGLLLCILAVTGLFSTLFAIIEAGFFFLPYVLVVAETSAKQAMVTVAAFGKSIHKGFGAMTLDNTKFSDFIIGLVFSGAVSYLLLGIYGIAALIISQIGGLIVLNTANRNFGGASGDVVGASNETGRIFSLLAFGGISWMLL